MNKPICVGDNVTQVLPCLEISAGLEIKTLAGRTIGIQDYIPIGLPLKRDWRITVGHRQRTICDYAGLPRSSQCQIRIPVSGLDPFTPLRAGLVCLMRLQFLLKCSSSCRPNSSSLHRPFRVHAFALIFHDLCPFFHHLASVYCFGG